MLYTSQLTKWLALRTTVVMRTHTHTHTHTHNCAVIGSGYGSGCVVIKMLTLHKGRRSLEDSAPVLSPLLDAFTFDLVESGKGPGQAFTQHTGGVNLKKQPNEQINERYHSKIIICQCFIQNHYF